MASRPDRRRARTAFVPLVEGVEARLLLSTAEVDNRVPVANTTAYPYSAVVRLWVTFPDDHSFPVSGAMIDSTHVLTAAHCIYSKGDGGWASSVIVTPGQTGATVPLGTYEAVRETIYTDYEQHETRGNNDFTHDVALLRLNVPTVPAVGALGQAVLSTDYFRGAPVTTSGYPYDLPASGAPPRGSVMYTTTGHTTHAVPRLIFYTNPTAGGQSGSPLYQTLDGGAYLEGVVSHSIDGERTVGFNNGAVRLTSALASDLKTWEAVDSVPDPSVFQHAALPHDPTTYRITPPYSLQALMHVMGT